MLVSGRRPTGAGCADSVSRVDIRYKLYTCIVCIDYFVFLCRLQFIRVQAIIIETVVNKSSKKKKKKTAKGEQVSRSCEDVAVPSGNGLRGISTTESGGRGGRWSPSPGARRAAQHQPRVHALLVRTGGPLCPVQTESGSSPRARACCVYIFYIS